MTLMTADEVKKLLRLEPHPCEGGWFIQTWRADETIPKSALPARYPEDRAAGTAIYYLLEPHTFSELHRLASDEIFHFYLGDPVEIGDAIWLFIKIIQTWLHYGEALGAICPSIVGRHD